VSGTYSNHWALKGLLTGDTGLDPRGVRLGCTVCGRGGTDKTSQITTLSFTDPPTYLSSTVRWVTSVTAIFV
jgi:hypothetical protein